MARPKSFDFALDVVGDPEAAELLAYVQGLEAALQAARTELEWWVD